MPLVSWIRLIPLPRWSWPSWAGSGRVGSGLRAISCGRFVAVNHHYAAHLLHLPSHCQDTALLAAVETSIAGVRFPFYRFGLSLRCVKTPWFESESELYRPSDRRLSSKLVATFCTWLHMVSVTDPYGRILGFIDRKLYYRAPASSSSWSYIAADGQSASSFWCLAPFGEGDQMLRIFEWQLLF
jgi:hypothetical protein